MTKKATKPKTKTRRADPMSETIKQQIHQLHTAKPAVPRQPRSQALPGLADRAVAPLEELAADIADVREQRAALARKEDDLNAKALTVMRQLGKTAYHRDGIDMKVIHGSEKLRINVKRDGQAPSARGEAARKAWETRRAAEAADDSTGPD